MPATAQNKTSRVKKLSHTNKPDELTLTDWQRGLRRQIAREQKMSFKNLGRERVFSEFAVTNRQTERTYRVAIRGEQPGMNYCACPDYAINTLGTCKHIEFVLAELGERWPAELKKNYAPPFAEVYVRYGPQREIHFSPGADCPPALLRLARRYFGAENLLPVSEHDTLDDFVREAAGNGHDLRVYDDALRLAAQRRDAQLRKARLRQKYGGRSADATWKTLLKVPLFPYQREGALFAAQAGRAIIADDMGLGKTIQAIAAAEILAREFGIERVLIVCPASLKYQWKHEIGQFSTRTARVIEGMTAQRAALYRGDEFFKIVNYDVIHRDVDAITACGPDLVILDEAQRIKNWQTRAARCVKRLDSRYCMVLTGTPLENRLEELHSIVEFVDRHRLGPLFAFKAAHEMHEADSTRVIGYQHLDQITKTLQPILIRRNKSEVLKQLPPRMDKNLFVPMTQEQWTPHEENRDIVARLVNKWRRFKFLCEEDQLRLRIALQYMRMSCDNTYLIDHETRFGTKVDELGRVLDETFETPGAKVIIFSQWVRMNELVAEMLDERGWGHVQLHGGVPSKQRAELTRALREDEKCRVFLSTDAGGVGLNLQSASTVINMDLPWNPAVLEQRIGRAHRMGQKNPVRVVNLISEGTIEHGMLSLLAFKKSIFAGVLDGATDQVMMKHDTLGRFMKTVESATANTPVVPLATEPADTDANVVDADAETTAAGVPLAPALPLIATPGPSFDAASFGQLLAQGAALLQTIGQALTVGPSAGSAARASTPGAPRVETDPKTGRAELRLPLPDAGVLQQWMGQLSKMFGHA